MIGMPTPQVEPSPWNSRTCTGLPVGADGEAAADEPAAGPAEGCPECQAPPALPAPLPLPPPPPQAAGRTRARPRAATRHHREILMTATMLRRTREPASGVAAGFARPDVSTAAR